MKYNSGILLLLFIVLLLPACEDGNSDYFLSYNLPLEWNTDFHAEWLTEDNVSLYLNIYPSRNNLQETGLEAEITIVSRTAANAPWETIFHERCRGGNQWTRSVPVSATGADTDILWFRVDCRIYLRNRIETEYSGPIIMTSRPLLRASTAITLPELSTENPFTNYSSDYYAPAVSPDGRSLFIGDKLSRVFDLETGRQTKMYAVSHNFDQSNAYWQTNAILITGSNLHAINPTTLDNTKAVKADYTFRRSDSEYVIIDRNSWLIYNPVSDKYTSKRAEFTLSADYDEQPGSISQRPDEDSYLVSHRNRFSDIWWLHDASFAPVRPLGPIDTTGLKFNPNISWSYYTHNLSEEGALWLSPDRLLVPTYWSGRKEYWLCDLAVNTYRQVTGFNPDAFPKLALTPYPAYTLYTIYPVHDAANNRLLFFFPYLEDRCGVRAIQVQ